MSISVDWHDDQKTAIYMQYHQGWTWDDFDAAVNQINIMAAQMNYRVDLIIDPRDAPNPPDIHVLSHFRKAASTRPHNSGMMYIFVTGGFLDMMGETFLKATGLDAIARFVRSMEEVDRLRAEQREVG